ncbi:MAG: hypothetical protein ACREPE_08145, partial [Lysobacter sp.]
PKALRDPGAARRMEQVCEASRFDGIGAAVDAALKIAIGNDGTGVGSILEGRDHEEPLRFAM